MTRPCIFFFSSSHRSLRQWDFSTGGFVSSAGLFVGFYGFRCLITLCSNENCLKEDLPKICCLNSLQTARSCCIIWNSADQARYTLNTIFLLLIHLQQESAELRAYLYRREEGEYFQLFESDHPVAVLRINLNPRRKQRTELSTKRKEPEPASISYNDIEPKRGLVRTENHATARYFSAIKPADGSVVIFHQSQITKVNDFFGPQQLTNDYPITGGTNGRNNRL